ncbi:PadR family transcriptional regulator [uncultured Cohaesibacter sp.]|uniref:PadR family transcriptional regulator n=1 Tax=uncultured Cohaesibacter sp. TaxID=1002546 RepID=UPI0029C811D9|nr:PadR family transcriptional regulator [uncultured Cohaesibacter sp.]
MIEQDIYSSRHGRHQRSEQAPFGPRGHRFGHSGHNDMHGEEESREHHKRARGQGRGHGRQEKFASDQEPSRSGFRGGGRSGGGFGGGRGSRFGNGGGGRRRGRFLGQGDIRLLSLKLIEQEPRHGYDIIKEVEALTNSFYAPSPGVIYPTLTYLEEAGYCAVHSDGNKKSYAITATGIEYLDENREEADRIIENLKALGARAERENEGSKPHGEPLPLSVETALLNLREVAARKIKEDPSSSSRIVQKLLALSEEL